MDTAARLCVGEFPRSGLEATRRAAAHPWRGRGGGAVTRARRRFVREHRSRRAWPARHVRASGERRRRGVASAGPAGGETRRRRNQFFFNDTATTEIYTLSLHDALPI